MTKRPAKPNRLIKEKSPYLIQHAHNPVDWYPWGEEAFAAARRADKPIFLSIGYATCHWCHVMERESFEDEAAARLLNETFINIKVDCEERPDINDVYMTACRMTTGSGGWPLTIVMTPDKKPFFAATYLPRTQRFGRAGLLDIVARIATLWREKRADIAAAAGRVTEAISAEAAGPHRSEDVGPEILETGFRRLSRAFDAERGGFGGAPKFPVSHNILFLLRRHRRTGLPESLDMAEKTIDAMRRGGIYDHLGFGFHRYSTDAGWLLPHFEKMLYDQAGLALAFTEAFQVTGKPRYRRTADEIFTYVLRDMTSPEGVFFSAEDADSEGEEGRFYTWPSEEFDRILGREDGAWAASIFGVRPEGNFSDPAEPGLTGRNILFLKAEIEETHRTRFEGIRTRLLEARNTRVRPLLDDKVLADWNGFMIAALARAARVFDVPEYTRAAGRAARFVLDRMRRPDGRLLHTFREGSAAIDAFLDDYAFMIWGLVELYETTFEAAWLDTAGELLRTAEELFVDGTRGGYFLTAGDAEPLPFRPKPITDGAMPSGNSVMLMNLLRFSRLTADASLEDAAQRVVRGMAAEVRRTPEALTFALAALESAFGPTIEVVIAGDPESEDTRRMLQSVRQGFFPETTVHVLPPGPQGRPTAERLPFAADIKMLDGKATAYVCRGGSCGRPVTEPDELLAMLLNRSAEIPNGAACP
ncbi:MAG: thioredoxin domain-containing protein [Acidobacteriota bacterium]|nr:thioredoxin domain-containing protein [Acidobacteriota bacterium]